MTCISKNKETFTFTVVSYSNDFLTPMGQKAELAQLGRKYNNYNVASINQSVQTGSTQYP